MEEDSHNEQYGSEEESEGGEEEDEMDEMDEVEDEVLDGPCYKIILKYILG